MAGTTRVSEVMSRRVHTLRPDQSIAEAAEMMASHGFGAMPVVGGDSRLLGLLRDEDLIVSEARVHVPTIINFLGATIPLPTSMHRFEEEIRKFAGGTVSEVMDEAPPVIGPEETLEELATRMHEKDVTHLPVVDKGRVVGIVARGDLVRFIARTT